MDARLTPRLLAVVFAAAALTGCGSGQESAAPVEPSPSTATDPAAAEATRAAERFLAALVAKEHGVAYDLLSTRARGMATQKQFVLAREQKTGSARSLGRTYHLTGTVGGSDLFTVTGEGLLADATDVRLVLSMTREGGQWRVDEVPKAF